MSIKFIYFDVGGVLFHFRSGLREMAAKHNLEYSDFERVFRKYDKDVVKGFISPQQLWEINQKELNFSDPDINFLEYWVSRLVPIPETHEYISELIRSNHSVGLITNLYSGVFEKAIEQGKIPDLPYATVIKSSTIHLAKPEPEIYLYAQEQARTKPENILFIDDKPNFLEPAKELGWKTYLFDEINPQISINGISSILNGVDKTVND